MVNKDEKTQIDWVICSFDTMSYLQEILLYDKFKKGCEIVCSINHPKYSSFKTPGGNKSAPFPQTR